MQQLRAADIERELASTPGWELVEDSIVRTVKFQDFKAAMAYVNRVAEVAEELNHHPDIEIRWNIVVLTQTTHAAGGLTEHDFRLARRLNAL
ncbi:4a-hydroxytetrahydrobiopterin dehydratase [Actinoallomurus acaciae]|uniref:Putative pterin-4-alpha-carbinolamine dehydratase n=1 Tax=Actinoallomurus acaciae TaxID=502577 RepID=A0ABV5YLC9_9ACTN